jgi:hypothetical protein
MFRRGDIDDMIPAWRRRGEGDLLGAESKDMRKTDRPAKDLELQRQALLKELDLVHAALADAAGAAHSPSIAAWLRKVEDRHDELHFLLAHLPRSDDRQAG